MASPSLPKNTSASSNKGSAIKHSANGHVLVVYADMSIWDPIDNKWVKPEDTNFKKGA